MDADNAGNADSGREREGRAALRSLVRVVPCAVGVAGVLARSGVVGVVGAAVVVGVVGVPLLIPSDSAE